MWIVRLGSLKLRNIAVRHMADIDVSVVAPGF